MIGGDVGATSGVVSNPSAATDDITGLGLTLDPSGNFGQFPVQSYCRSIRLIFLELLSMQLRQTRSTEKCMLPISMEIQQILEIRRCF